VLVLYESLGQRDLVFWVVDKTFENVWSVRSV